MVLEQTTEGSRKCVACGRQIDFNVNVCPYCGKDYRELNYGQPPVMQPPMMQQPMMMPPPMASVGKGSGAGAAVGVIGSIMVLLGIFLPWISAMGIMSFSGWDINSAGAYIGVTVWEVWVLLILGILCLMLSIVEAVSAKAGGAAVLVFGIMAMLVSIMSYNELAPVVSMYPGIVSIGLGLYVCIIGAIIAIVGGVIGLAKKTAPSMPMMPMQPMQPMRPY